MRQQTLFDSEEMAETAAHVIFKLVRRKVVGGHKKSIDEVVNWFPSDAQGEVKEVIRAMVRDPDFPLERYGGKDVIRLSNYYEAKEFAEEYGYDTQWYKLDE